MNYKYDLCFCIPTYNRCQQVTRLIKSILSCSDQRISIVVLDNGSTDETMACLNEINDERLSVMTNGENKGALFNMINVLAKSNGKFAIYSTDQDHINPELIPDFISYLSSQTNIVCGGYCLFPHDKNHKDTGGVYAKGIDALKHFAYLGRHPTGYFFNTDLLKGTEILTKYSDYEFVDLFPLEFVFADISLQGDGLIYQKQLFSPEMSGSISKNKSATTDGKQKSSFFHPFSRLKLASSYSRHAFKLPLNEDEKMDIISIIFIRGLLASTIGFKGVISNKDLCEHYYMISRNVSIWEMLNIAFNYVNGFINNTRKYYSTSVMSQLYFYSKLLVVTSSIFVRKLFSKA